jgi:hypothetical protein
LALDRDQLRRLARLGAQARITELRREITAIERAFPDVREGRENGPRKGGQAGRRARPSKRSSSRKPKWSAAQRKAAADRMKAYWAKRKGGKKQTA